jgi:hypothetical protein
MSQSISSRPGAMIMNIRRSTVLALIAVILALPGCGSTKVYTADKSLVYGSTLYNLSAVKSVSPRIEGTLPDGKKINLDRTDKKAFNALLDEHETLVVATIIDLDDKELVYQNSRVKSYSEFSKMVKRQDSAMNSIRKFMANKKSRQLKLK